MKKIVVLTCVLLVVSFASADTFRYQGNGDWSDASKWINQTAGNTTGALPGATDTVRANWGGATITLGNEQTVGQFQAGVDESGTFHILNGGILNAGNSKVGNNGASTGTLIIDAGGTVNANGGWLMIAGNSTVTGVADVTGTLNAAGHLWMATGAGSTATLEINSGGLVTTGGMLGLGTVNAIDPSGGIATININDGGTLDLANIHGAGTSIQPGSMINIYGSGAIVMEGDYLGHFNNNYIPDGYISGDGVIGNVEAAFDGTYTTVTVVPEPATMVLLGLGGLLLRRKK